tara:strand:+ start:759 stop:1052 length:294 start_codon:yes stop_codon:yes gene_type:complete
MPNQQEIKELANKLLTNGVASTMMDAMEKATDMLIVEEKETNKKIISNEPSINTSLLNSEKQEGETNKDSAEHGNNEPEDISKETKTVKELMEEFSE